MESDHMLMIIKLRLQNKSMPQQRLNGGNVTTLYRHELKAELPGVSETEPLSLNHKWIDVGIQNNSSEHSFNIQFFSETKSLFTN
jgi:hypothetical protein